eukprot:40130-Chlamydomonas_euryale.AAC.2
MPAEQQHGLTHPFTHAPHHEPAAPQALERRAEDDGAWIYTPIHTCSTPQTTHLQDLKHWSEALTLAEQLDPESIPVICKASGAPPGREGDKCGVWAWERCVTA